MVFYSSWSRSLNIYHFMPLVLQKTGNGWSHEHSTGAPIENIVQNHLNIALLNVF